MNKKRYGFAGLVLLCAGFSTRANAAEKAYLGIPLKPDPPPAIDGRLDEWTAVPNAQVIDTAQHAVFGGHTWKSADDLSAKVWLAWRQENLYLAADVTDDRVVQKAQSTAMWQGDHIELYIDAAPDFETARDTAGVGQLQLGFSPGNFQKTGDPTVDKSPEAVVFRPQNGSGEGIRVAAQRTPRGYVLEAAIPWTTIARLAGHEIGTPATGWPLALEVAVSDTDSDEPQQEKIMTLQTTPWEHGLRSRWLPAVLAPADGIAPPVQQKLTIFETVELAPDAKQEVRFQAPATPAGKEAVLTLKARIDYPEVGGYSQALGLSLNGVELNAKRLRNRGEVEELRSGKSIPSFGGGRFTTPYAPDFESPDQSADYAFRKVKAAPLEFDVTGILRAGENVLLLNSEPRPTPNKVIAAQGRLEFREPYVPPVKRAAPTGPLPIYQPNLQHKVAYHITDNADGSMALRIGQTTFNVASQFSTPDGNWQKGSNKFFTHRRTIKQQDEAIVVEDQFVNLTDENLPLMQQHRVLVPQGGAAQEKRASLLKKVWLGGLSPANLNGTASDPGNPTTYGIDGKVGVGLMPLDDVLQVHTTNFSTPDSIGLADNQFVLKPKATHTSEWVILPTATADYYDFVNAARRVRDVNFKIDGAFAFFFGSPTRANSHWSDEKWKDFFRFKNVKYACNGQIPYDKNGLVAQGTAAQKVDWSFQKALIARLKPLAPNTEFSTYFHCFLDVDPEAVTKYANARTLRSDGTQSDYGNPGYKNFVPTATNSFGRDLAKNVDFILAPQPAGLGCEGVYWDEIEYSAARYHYDDFGHPKSGLPWDGVSADIDPRTKKILALKSSVTLISQPYREGLVKRILKHGQLIGNGAPHTRSMMQFHFPRFVETGSISNCVLSHLYTPIALGDHLTEQSALDAYRWMVKALDYGCVYAWYTDIGVEPTHPMLTEYMFPITPLELHEGYIVGQERILTNRSGLFGWGDNSKHEVHVFNDEGKEVKDFKAETIEKDGKTFTELRLAEDWSAAIIRK